MHKASAYVSSEEVVIRRYLRKLARAHSFRVQTTVIRHSVNTSTGEVVARLRRSGKRFSHYREESGFLLVNDGARLAGDLARLFQSREIEPSMGSVFTREGTKNRATHERRPVLVIVSDSGDRGSGGRPDAVPVENGPLDPAFSAASGEASEAVA